MMPKTILIVFFTFCLGSIKATTCGSFTCQTGEDCDNSVIPPKCVYVTCSTDPIGHACGTGQTCNGEGVYATCVNYYQVTTSDPSISLGNLAF